MGANDFNNLNQTVNTQPNIQPNPTSIPMTDLAIQTVSQRSTAPIPVADNNQEQDYGPNGPMPDELRHWSWAAFLGSWVWGISQKVWLALVILPLIGLPLFINSEFNFSAATFRIISILVLCLSIAFLIFLGVCGNELAWNSRKYRDIEHFKKTQIFWAILGIFIAIWQSMQILFMAFLLHGEM